MTAASKKFQMDDTDGFALMNDREKKFALFMLASRLPKWSAKRAGYVGDMSKRTACLLRRPYIQRFLKTYSTSPPRGIEVSKEGLLKKLAQIASGQIVKINTSDVLKAVELIGKSLGMWEATSQEGRDRLREMVAAFRAGAVQTKKEPEE